MIQPIQKPDRVRPHPRRLILLLVGAAAMVLLLAVLLAAGGSGTGFVQTEVNILTAGWVDDGGTAVTLPIKDHCPAVGWTMQIQIPPSGSPRSLYFYAKYQNIRLYLDGELLGECLCREPGQTVTQGKVFALFSIPERGGLLRMETEPLLADAIPYEVSAPFLGPAEALMHQAIGDELPTLLVTVMIFCFGLFLLICGLQALHSVSAHGEAQTFQASFLYIGLFALVFALYSLVITDTLHFFVSNHYLICVLEFMLLALIPLAPLALAAEYCTPRFRALLTANCALLFLNCAIQAAFHFLMGLELRRWLNVTHFLIVVSAVVLLLALVSAGRKADGSWWPLLSFSPVLIGAVADVLRFYLPVFYQKAIGFQVGVMVFLLLQTAYLLRQNLAYYESYLRSSTYRQMAYTDALTGLANRAAFEAELNRVQEKLEGYSAVWCLSTDINNLKQINDTLGHAAGDALIRGAAELLRTAVGKDATVYRIGGDEFVCLLFDRSEAAVRAVCQGLDEAAERYNAAHVSSLSIALGCDRFRFSEEDTMAKLLSRADALMYENKRRWKRA